MCELDVHVFWGKTVGIVAGLIFFSLSLPLLCMYIHIYISISKSKQQPQAMRMFSPSGASEHKLYKYNIIESNIIYTYIYIHICIFICCSIAPPGKLQ